MRVTSCQSIPILCAFGHIIIMDLQKFEFISFFISDANLGSYFKTLKGFLFFSRFSSINN